MITHKPGHKRDENKRNGRAKGILRTHRTFATGLSEIRCRWDLSWLRASSLTGPDAWQATDLDTEAHHDSHP